MLRIRIDMLMEFPDDFTSWEIKDVMETGEYFPDNVVSVSLGYSGYTNEYRDNYYTHILH